MAHWSTLAACPVSSISNVVLLNAKDIITAPYNTEGVTGQGILRYNISSKKWKVFIKYPANLKSTKHCIAVSFNLLESKLIYLYGAESYMFTFNLPSGFQKYQKSDSLKAYKGGIDINNGASMIIISGQCHLIGGQTNCKHLIWNNSSSEWLEKYTFDSVKNGNRNNGLIYLKNKGILYLFGGNDHGISDLDEIWEYTVKKGKWERIMIRMPFKMNGFGIICTEKERYIIFFGGESNGKLLNDILIFDTLYKSFKMSSSIKCPIYGKFHAVLLQNKEIHLFQQNGGKHWAIKVNKICDGKQTALQHKYGDDGDDEDEKKQDINDDVDTQKLNENPGMDLKSNDIDKNSNDNKSDLVHLYLNNALNEISKAILILKDNQNNDNKQDIDFTADVAKIQNGIDILMQLKNVDVLQYKTWTLDQMVLWISQLENARFCKYIDVLKNGFIAQNIENGSELPDINSLMLKKPPFNIQNGMDRDDLIKHFSSLINGGSNINEGNNNNNEDNNNYQAEGAETAGHDVFV